ncbi:hypothetical protein C7S13_3587 [Burkholderia cepacia]|nr:hypothetical protein [Burkholderia cepacia]
MHFRQSCAVGEPFERTRVHVSVSGLQAYCSLENQSFRANLYVDADSHPIAVKIGN